MKKVPFYSNTKDNTHCFQAVLKMICGYYFPEEKYSWEDLDTITQKKKDLWTWPMAGYIWLAKRNLQIESISNWNFEAFAREGVEYTRREFGDEVALGQAEHADISQGIHLAQELLQTSHFIQYCSTIA
jgi:hypothetical protein